MVSPENEIFGDRTATRSIANNCESSIITETNALHLSAAMKLLPDNSFDHPLFHFQNKREIWVFGLNEICFNSPAHLSFYCSRFKQIAACRRFLKDSRRFAQLP